MPSLNIEIARTGTFTTAKGQSVSLTRDVLAEIAASYDPEMHPSPLVLGHPEMDDPAWGWARTLMLGDDNVLRAVSDDVAPEFAEGVKLGRYRKVSMAAFPPAHPSNPKPGQWYLKHIGFLGARPPAIPGLKPVSFAASPDDVVVEFASLGSWGLSRVLRSLREWFIDKHDLATADQVVPDWVVVEAEQSARSEQESAVRPFAAPALSIEDDTMTETELKAREEAILASEKRLKEEKAILDQQATRLAALQIEMAAQEARDFVAEQVEAGRILPRHQAQVVALLCSQPQTAVITFADGDGKTVEMGSSAFLREFIGSLPKQVEYRESAAPESGTQGVHAFAAPEGMPVDQAGLKLYQAAKRHQAAHPGMSFEDALRAIS